LGERGIPAADRGGGGGGGGGVRKRGDLEFKRKTSYTTLRLHREGGEGLPRLGGKWLGRTLPNTEKHDDRGLKAPKTCQVFLSWANLKSGESLYCCHEKVKKSGVLSFGKDRQTGFLTRQGSQVPLERHKNTIGKAMFPGGGFLAGGPV